MIGEVLYCSTLSNYRRKMEVGAVVEPRASGPVYLGRCSQKRTGKEEEVEEEEGRRRGRRQLGR